jgi:hypothetical protein
VTAARVKALKMEARRGEVIEPVAPPAAGRLVLKRGERQRVEHFTLHVNDSGNVEVLDAQNRVLVEFLRVRKGQIRRWQELQLAVVDASPERISLDLETKPGATCFGSGRYRALRPGLQVHAGPDRSTTVAAWDPRKPELTLKFQGPNVDVERKVALNGKGEVLGISYHLQADPGGGTALLLETAD